MTQPENFASPSALALQTLQGLLSCGDLNAQATLESEDEENAMLAISGADAALLVSGHGQTLDALQYLLMLIVNKGRDQRLRITVDADGYRARREKTLVSFANSLAEQVVANGEEAVTDSLSPMERRIIHTALAEHPGVQTYSEGEEPNRFVVLSPRQP